MGASQGPEVGVTLGSWGAWHPHKVLTRGRQRVGGPETADPALLAVRMEGAPWARKRQEPCLPGVLGLLSPELSENQSLWF